MRFAIFASLLITAGLYAACSPYSPNLGATPFLCGSGTPQCPDGYKCMSGSGSNLQKCAAHCWSCNASPTRSAHRRLRKRGVHCGNLAGSTGS